MKNTFLTLLCSWFTLIALGQSSAPVWTRTFDGSADTSTIRPVKTMYDSQGYVLVVANYSKQIGPDFIYKIFLYKYNPNGSLIWSNMYDHNGTGEPRAFDVAMDNIDNIYIAGGLMDFPSFKPLIVRLNSTGNEIWSTDTLNNVPTGILKHIIWQNNKLFVGGTGVAVCRDNGQELWSVATDIEDLEVDNTDRMLITNYDATDNFVAYNSNGSVNFAATTIYGSEIALSQDGSIYLLNDQPYDLQKFNSQGQLQWQYSNFFTSPGFGDIGFDVITDYDNNVYAIGLEDSMFKFDPSGNVLWRKGMNGMDTYLISTKLYGSNVLFIAGTVNGFAGYDQAVAAIDMFGNEIWSGSYNATNQSEYVVDMIPGLDGIFVLADSASQMMLSKYQSPFSMSTDYSLVCVDSIWYDSINPDFLNIRIYNGNAAHMNYPSVQVIAPNGDTIVNRINYVNFFAHMGNSFQVYTDSVFVQGITDWSSYTFRMNELFGDTGGTIGFCDFTGIDETDLSELLLYPNPAKNFCSITGLKNDQYEFRLTNNLGQELQSATIRDQETMSIDISSYASGLYFINLKNGKKIRHFRLLIE